MDGAVIGNELPISIAFRLISRLEVKQRTTFVIPIKDQFLWKFSNIGLF